VSEYLNGENDMKTVYIIGLVLLCSTSAYADIVPVPTEEEPKVEKKIEKKEPVEKIEKRELTPFDRCCSNDIDLSPLYESSSRNKISGNVNINIRFGKRGNLNIRNRW
jgi:hypothetical protein